MPVGGGWWCWVPFRSEGKTERSPTESALIIQNAEEKQTVLGQIRTPPKGRKGAARVHESEKSK